MHALKEGMKQLTLQYKVILLFFLSLLLSFSLCLLFFLFHNLQKFDIFIQDFTKKNGTYATEGDVTEWSN
jgi:hypothetical protein